MKTIEQIIEDVIAVEGGYTNDPNDAGGPTKFGITEAVARVHGYMGDMRDFPVEKAREIYNETYVTQPKFDAVFKLAPDVAIELIDTGVNMGPATSAKMLQRSLNVLNQQQKFYPDIPVDGLLGSGSIAALSSFLQKRGASGNVVLLRMLNALQCVRYIELAEKKPTQEDFLFGWVLNRVVV